MVGGGGGRRGRKGEGGGGRGEPFTAKLFCSGQCLVSFYSRFSPVGPFLVVVPGPQVCEETPDPAVLTSLKPHGEQPCLSRANWAFSAGTAGTQLSWPLSVSLGSVEPWRYPTQRSNGSAGQLCRTFNHTRCQWRV